MLESLGYMQDAGLKLVRVKVWGHGYGYSQHCGIVEGENNPFFSTPPVIQTRGF